MEEQLAEQIEKAVAAAVDPLPVAVKQNGEVILVKVYGSDRTFGYRKTMDDGTPNLHTPESFAAEVAMLASQDVQKHVDALASAKAKRARRAEKRIKELARHPRV